MVPRPKARSLGVHRIGPAILSRRAAKTMTIEAAPISAWRSENSSVIISRPIRPNSKRFSSSSSTSQKAKSRSLVSDRNNRGRADKRLAQRKLKRHNFQTNQAKQQKIQQLIQYLPEGEKSLPCFVRHGLPFAPVADNKPHHNYRDRCRDMGRLSGSISGRGHGHGDENLDRIAIDAAQHRHSEVAYDRSKGGAAQNFSS